MEQARGNDDHMKKKTNSMFESNKHDIDSHHEDVSYEEDANVFQRLGVYEVLRRREMAKIKAARRRDMAHYRSKDHDIENGTSVMNTDFEKYHQTFLKSKKRPSNPSQYLIPQHLDPDECSFNPLITAKAKRLPSRSGDDMCRDAIIYSEKRKQLVLNDDNKQSHMETFKPNMLTRSKPASNPSSKFVKKAVSSIKVLKNEPTSSYIERLRIKADSKEKIRNELKMKRELEELSGCTFEPDLPPCPQFIHQLADGFKKAKDNKKQLYNDIYQGKNNKYKKIPDWQTVSVNDGSVHGERWGKVVITDPSVQLATCTRSLVGTRK